MYSVAGRLYCTVIVCYSVFYLLPSYVLIPIGFFLEIQARAGRFLSSAMQLHSQLIAVSHLPKFYARKVTCVCILIQKDCKSVFEVIISWKVLCVTILKDLIEYTLCYFGHWPPDFAYPLCLDFSVVVKFFVVISIFILGSKKSFTSLKECDDPRIRFLKLRLTLMEWGVHYPIVSQFLMFEHHLFFCFSDN